MPSPPRKSCTLPHGAIRSGAKVLFVEPEQRMGIAPKKTERSNHAVWDVEAHSGFGPLSYLMAGCKLGWWQRLATTKAKPISVLASWLGSCHELSMMSIVLWVAAAA